MKYTEEYIDELLGKYLADENMSEQELQTVKKWISENPDDYNRLLKITSSAKEPFFDKEKAWNKIETHINKNINQYKTIPIGRKREKDSYMGMSIFYAAASVIIIIAITLSFFNSKKNHSEMIYANSTGVRKTIYLPDSSSVILYPDASITYCSGDKTSERNVTLSGKAFFDVRIMNGRSFKVKSDNLMVQVLGTSFLVDTETEGKSGVYVKTGTVKVESNSCHVIIKANQKAELRNDSLISGNIDNPYEIFEEKPSTLSFNDTAIQEVTKQIQQATGLRIDIGKDLESNTITTRINLNNYEDIVKELAFLCNCRYETIETDRHYRLY